MRTWKKVKRRDDRSEDWFGLPVLRASPMFEPQPGEQWLEATCGRQLGPSRRRPGEACGTLLSLLVARAGIFQRVVGLEGRYRGRVQPPGVDEDELWMRWLCKDGPGGHGCSGVYIVHREQLEAAVHRAITEGRRHLVFDVDV